MEWSKLLSLNKYGVKSNRLRKDENPVRVAFDVDYDRIVFSDSFRSLQDKTQVIPFSKSGFVHTRLTHSIEVSVVGRSLGRSVGAEILKKYPELAEQGYTFNDFGSILASAALAHDIGNPPFGHSGEKAIGDFFRFGKGKIIKDLVTDAQYEDLCLFEGNANGFRILTKGLGEERKGGFRLSYATLGSFLKYPKESLPHKPSSKIFHKKFSFFQSEKEFFLEVAKDLGLERILGEKISYCRHPLAYLVEAADDICYTIIDFEDGINLGLIDERYAREFLINLVQDSKVNKDTILNNYDNLSQKKRQNRLS